MDFANVLDSVFRRFGVAATYKAGGAGAGIAVTVLRRSPDAAADIFGAEVVRPTNRIEVRVAEVAQVAAADTFTISGDVLTVKPTPSRDRDRLVWTVDLVA